jgi:LysM repeat protein
MAMDEEQRDLLDTIDMNAAEEDYLDEVEYSSWEKKVENKARFGPFKRSRAPLFLLALGLVALLILSIMLIARSRNNEDAARLRSLEARFTQLESRVAKLEGSDKGLAQVEEQGTELATLRQRLDSLEASISRKTTRPAQEGKRSRYHLVRPGDTLYGISRHYGLTVEELRRLNKLAPGAVIRPDQKLVVSTGSSG